MASVDELGSNVDDMRGEVDLGGGAQFWVYVSPQNETDARVPDWAVMFRQGTWTGMITSENPKQVLQTPDLSGEFNVAVLAQGPNLPAGLLSPVEGGQANIGCNDNCGAFVGIVASPTSLGANYWTTWDAICQG